MALPLAAVSRLDEPTKPEKPSSTPESPKKSALKNGAAGAHKKESTNEFIVRPPECRPAGGVSPKVRGALQKSSMHACAASTEADEDVLPDMEMRPVGHCMHCGNVLMSDSQFCRQCGKQQKCERLSILQSSWQSKCACGNTFAADALFCRRCGAKRSGISEHSEQEPNGTSRVKSPTSLELPAWSARELCKHTYKQAGQDWLWNQAESLAAGVSTLLSDGRAAEHLEKTLVEQSAETCTASEAGPSQSCAHCGNIFLFDSLYCRKCGLERAGGQEVAAKHKEAAGVCLVCGNEFMPDAQYCRLCGTQRQEQGWRKKGCNRSSVRFNINARQEVYVLQMEEATTPKSGGHQTKSFAPDSTANGDAPAEISTSGSTAVAAEENPLKDIMTEKKVKVDKVRALLTSLPDVTRWLEIPLEIGLPFVERPLVHAVAQIDVGLVSLLLECKAESSKPYDGAKMYKGWIKPGSTLTESVRSRKGRFVGTMLGDKLDKIENLLQVAGSSSDSGVKDCAAPSDIANPDVAAAVAAAAAAAAAAPRSASPEELEEPPSAQSNSTGSGRDGRSRMRKSVVVRTALGHLHTRGHPQEKYEIQDQVDDGDTSSIWLGVNKESRQAIAIKVEPKNDENILWEEIAMLNQFCHENVVTLHETYETSDQLYCVLDLCRGGRMFEIFYGNMEVGVKNMLAMRRLLKQQLLAIQHIHNHCVCHRNIQLDNFLIVEKSPLDNLELATVKLIDFTTSKRFGIGFDSMKTKICTPAYCAWEICQRGDKPYTEKIDIWSLGVTFFIMLCGRQPFTGSNDFDVLKKIKKSVYQFEPTDVWQQVPMEAQDLIRKMIVKPADTRLSATQVLEQSWIASLT